MNYTFIRRLKVLIVSSIIASMIALSGCTKVHVRIPLATSDDSADIQQALAYAAKAREHYLGAVYEQTELRQNLSNGLIGLGAIMIALAVGEANTEILQGTALVGGTGLALGNWNSRPQRQLIHLAGAEAIDCAARAVTPLAIGANEQSMLGKTLMPQPSESESPYTKAWIETKTAALNLVAASASLAALNPGHPLITNTTIQLAEVNRLLDESHIAQTAGVKLLNRAQLAPYRLIQAVQRISNQVDRALLETLPDINSVGQVVASLSGFADIFAPGAGIGASFKGSLEQSIAASQSGGGRVTEDNEYSRITQLQRAFGSLANAQARLEALYIPVKAIVDVVGEARAADTLEDCKVEGVITALKVPERLKLTKNKARTYSLFVAGGLKPYVARLQESPVEHISVRNPLPGGSLVELTTTAQWTGETLHLLIVDSSTPNKHATVLIEPQADATSAAVPPATTGSLPDFSVINGLDIGNGVLLSVEAVSGTEVSVTCDPESTAAVDEISVKSAMLSFTPLGQSSPLGLNMVGSDQEKLAAFQLRDDGTCKISSTATPASQSGGGRIEFPADVSTSRSLLKNLGCAKISLLQRNLCIERQGVDCDWRSGSQKALNDWRLRTDSSVTGGLTKAEIQTLINATDADVSSWCASPAPP